MKRTLQLWVFVLACACAGNPTSVAERDPLVAPEPPAPDETPQIREVLEQFLQARWTFDHEASLAFVTEEDAANPWQDDTERHLLSVRQEDRWTEHTWRIETIDVEDGAATATVEVIGPGLRETMTFQVRSSYRVIRATPRWIRDPEKRKLELDTVRPPRRVRTLTYHLRKSDDGWRVFMDWAGVQAMREERDAAIYQEVFEAFDGSEKELHARPPALDERTRTLLDALEQAERAVHDHDYTRAKRLYEELLVSDATVPDFLSDRAASFDSLAQLQQKKLARAKVEVGPLRKVGDTYEIRVKNKGEALRSYRLVAEHGDDRGVSYRSTNKDTLAAGDSNSVRIRPRRGKPPVKVRLVDVTFEDQELEKQFEVPRDMTFRRRVEDLRTGGVARANAYRVATVLDANTAQFDKCPWSAEDVYVDLWIEVETPPRAKVSRALTDDEKLGKCLSKTAARLEYPDAANNRSVVRVYPRHHWWRE